MTIEKIEALRASINDLHSRIDYEDYTELIDAIDIIRTDYEAETGTLKTKLVEQAARISEHEAINEAMGSNEYMRMIVKEQTQYLKTKELTAQNQALKSELEKYSAGVVARFEIQPAVSNVVTGTTEARAEELRKIEAKGKK